MLGNTSNSVLSDRVYDLIQELNTIQPTVLLSVLPQLEFKLKVDVLLYLALVLIAGLAASVNIVTMLDMLHVAS